MKSDEKHESKPLDAEERRRMTELADKDKPTEAEKRELRQLEERSAEHAGPSAAEPHPVSTERLAPLTHQEERDEILAMIDQIGHVIPNGHQLVQRVARLRARIEQSR